MAEKGKIRSIRFKDEIYELIEQQEGETFTQKFENLVTRCVKELPQKRQQLTQIQMQIDLERAQLNNLRNQKRKFETNIRDMNWALEDAKRRIERAAKAFEGGA